MSNQDKNFSLTAFLVGGILGASASLLFTPRSGKELRDDIKQQTDNYLKEVKLRRDTLISRSKSTGELLKRKAEDLMETIKNYANGKIEKPFFVIEKEIAGLKICHKCCPCFLFKYNGDTWNTDKWRRTLSCKWIWRTICFPNISEWEKEEAEKASIRKTYNII